MRLATVYTTTTRPRGAPVTVIITAFQTLRCLFFREKYCRVMRKSRVLRDEDDDDDEPLVNFMLAAAAAATERVIHVVSSDSGSSSDNEEGFKSESGDEQIMFFNPLFFEFQKLHWLSASSEAAKQFAARKHARSIKRQKCRENAERRRERSQRLDENLPKIHTRKRVSHHSKSGQRDDRLARSEGEISTVEEVD